MENITMTNDCKTCPVSTGTHKPAEAVHQIAEPQPEALRLAAWLLHRSMSGIKQNDIEASNQLRWLHAESLQHKQELAASRFTVANREARIAELESQLEAIGAGGVEPLRNPAAAQQACSRSHPHEEMTPMCELRTEIARLTNALARAEAQLAAAQQAVQAAPLPLLVRDIARDLGITVPQACIALKPLGNYSTNSAVTAEMAKLLRDSFPATAHPAEGVPAQDVEAKIGELLALARRMVRAALDADNKTEMQEIKAAIDSEVEFERTLRNTLATHPTQQGLEQAIRALPRVTYGYKSDGEGRYLTSYESSEGQFLRHADVMAALAAQAKQGGV